MANIFTQD